MSEHKQGIFPGFTKRYGVKTLVYYEFHTSMDDAITREKRIKEWQRAWKIRLILSVNPQWLDLFDEATNRCSTCRMISSEPVDACRGSRPAPG